MFICLSDICIYKISEKDIYLANLYDLKFSIGEDLFRFIVRRYTNNLILFP